MDGASASKREGRSEEQAARQGGRWCDLCMWGRDGVRAEGARAAQDGA
jgi:hypothetical protein